MSPLSLSRSSCRRFFPSAAFWTSRGHRWGIKPIRSMLVVVLPPSWRANINRRGVKKDHAFLINSMPGGVSDRLDELKVDEDTTFRRLRRMIELIEDRGMMRRTPLFQELLFVMISSSNPHNYGKDLRYRYRLGVLNEDGEGQIPKLVPMEDEQSDMPVLDYYRNTARLDLVLVPATQISPSGVCTPDPDPEPELLCSPPTPDVKTRELHGGGRAKTSS